MLVTQKMGWCESLGCQIECFWAGYPRYGLIKSVWFPRIHE